MLPKEEAQWAFREQTRGFQFIWGRVGPGGAALGKRALPGLLLPPPFTFFGVGSDVFLTSSVL